MLHTVSHKNAPLSFRLPVLYKLGRFLAIFTIFVPVGRGMNTLQYIHLMG